MKMNRIMIAAPKSGSGKTTITCALLSLLKNRGKEVAAYKCGPDYIDPMFHKKVIGVPSANLDTFFTQEEETEELLLKNTGPDSFVVMEGVMGLFDGLAGIREEGSSYHLAKITGTPIILVIDAKGMGRSVIAEIAGFLAYDKEGLIRGILLNRTSKAYYDRIKPLIEEELGVPVIGYFPERKGMQIQSRHLGLVMPDELPDMQESLQMLAKELEKTVDVNLIEQTAQQAENLKLPERVRHREKIALPEEERPVIAVARDEAFCFYYEANLQMLRENGAEIKYFSPLHDETIPGDCDALLLGGGYPELYADRLSRNLPMRRSVRQAFDQKMPIVAECGGFMYLHDKITDREGISHEMAGVLEGVCDYRGKTVRFGYIELREKKPIFLQKGEIIKGHEFHYFDSTDNGESCIAAKPFAGREYSCVIEGETYWMGFPHLYYPSNPSFAEAFVKKAARYKREKEAV